MQNTASTGHSTPSQSQKVLDQLRTFIVEGGYNPGDRLPPERQLIDNLGLSRSVLRKGLDALEREGSIWRQVGKGTFISTDVGLALPDTLAVSRQVTPVQLMRARICLEPAISGEAAANASAESVARLQATRARAVEATSWDSYETEDDNFHLDVAKASGNVLLVSLFQHVNQVRRTVAWQTVVRKSDRPPVDHTSFKEHDNILSAIEKRDPTLAQNAMHDHLASVSVRLFGRI